MPRPGDWDAIGLGGDPTPGEPETIGQLAEVLQKLGGKAREIFNAIEAVMNSNDDSVFTGATAEALRGKVDGRLRGHVEDVANAFESSATALREWRTVVTEQQSKADAALGAGRGLAEDDPERDRQKGIAQQAGEYQSEQGSTFADRINGVSDIQLPISACEAFWEAFKWLAIILIIPALIFGGPIALLALGVNLALFIKTVVDVANGDASFLDLFLAGLGLIAPTTKALPIFSLLKNIGKAAIEGVKGFFQGFRQIFTKEFLFNGLLAGLRNLPMLANVAIRETGLFVITNLRNLPSFAGGIFRNGAQLTLTGITKLPSLVIGLPGTIGRGVLSGLKGFGAGAKSTWTFVGKHFGGTQWTRIFLPVNAAEIRASGFWPALKIGVYNRGVLGQYRFGAPLTGSIGRTISAIPINPGAVNSAAGDGLGHLTNVRPPSIELSAIRLGDLDNATGSGFLASHQIDGLGDIHLGNLAPIRSGDLGISVSTPTTITPGGLHIPATAGSPAPVGSAVSGIPSPHVGTPAVPVNGVANGLPTPGQTGVPFSHIAGVTNVPPSAVSNATSLHVPAPSSASIGDLIGAPIRTNTPGISPHFASQIGEGTSHGFAANQIRLSIDEIVNLPAGSQLPLNHALSTPTVDRVNAALDLVNNNPGAIQAVTPPSALHTTRPATPEVNVHATPGAADFKTPAPTSLRIDNPGLAGSQSAPTVPNVSVQPVSVPVRSADLPIQPTTVHSPGRTDLPLTGLPDRPGAFVRIERLDGGMSTYHLFGGGPTGRIDALPGGSVRFTDTATGQTTRFDGSGMMADQGVRLTRADGVLRLDDRIVIQRPDGEFRVTTLTGDAVPEQLTVRPLDTGGVQVLGKEGVSWHYNPQGKLEGQSVSAAWDSDLAAKAGVFRKPGDTDVVVNARMDDFGQVQRPRLPGGGRTTTYDLPGQGGVRFDLNGSQVTMHGPGADLFDAQVAGRTLTVTQAGAVPHTWTYSLGFGGRANQVGESFPLNGGLFDGQPITLEGRLGSLDSGLLTDVRGQQWPVKVTDDGLTVVSPQGPLVYDRAGGFRGAQPTSAGHLPTPVPPPHLSGDQLTRWNAQVDASRTHLTVAGSDKSVEHLMKDVMGGAFTSKRGFGGYVNPTALADGTLVGKVHTFNTVTKDLLFKGPADNVTVYRGVSMDPLSAQADEFVERLPISTSNNLKFQEEWAQNGVQSNRVVFEIDVPAGHGKLSMSYPPGYRPGGDEARAWNQSQWEVTLAPTTLVRTGPDRIEDGMRIVPVRAEQIPASRYDEVITAKWPGLPSETAFNDFAKAFEPASLQKFDGWDDVSSRSTMSTDGLTNTVHVAKPGFSDELTITVMRDPRADSVRVTVASDGVNKFDQSWSGQKFSNLATDLRGNVLYDNDVFASMPTPWSWTKATVFRMPGDTDAVVFQRMDDWAKVERAQLEVDSIKRDFGGSTGRADGPSTGPSVGEQAKLELHLVQQQLDEAKEAFRAAHGLDPDDTAQWISQLRSDDLMLHPGLPGASGRPSRGLDLPGQDGVQILRQGPNLQLSEGADLFRMRPPGTDGTVVVERLGSIGGDVVHTWTVRPGFRPSVVGETLTLTDGPLAGRFVELRGSAGQLDGLLDDAGASWPLRASGDDLLVATPGGPQRYDRNGAFQGPAPTATEHLLTPTPAQGFTGDVSRWTAQVDLSRTHLTAAGSDKAVENLMKDVVGGTFTSKRGFGGFVKPSALADGTLAAKVENFNTVTRDLLLKGSDSDVTLYRGVSMDPLSAQADEFVDRLPSSTSNNLQFQEEWAKNGAAGNRFVFEIEVPAGHGKLSMSYPPGYRPGGDEARAWNQSQWEVTLAPTTLIRTGPDRIEDGMKIIPVRAEQIPAGQLAASMDEAWPGLPIQTAFDDFVHAFGEGSVSRWDGFENVTVKSATGADGTITTLTLGKPGYADELTVQVSRDVDADTVSVRITGGETEFAKGPWKGTDLGDIAAQLRGNVLHDNDLFLSLPKPASWSREPVVVQEVRLQGMPDNVQVKVETSGGVSKYELLNSPPGSKLDVLPGGEFRLTDGSRSFRFDGEGTLIDEQFRLTGLNDGRSVLRGVDGRGEVTGPNAERYGVQALDGGGFRVTGPHGQMQRYAADGAHLGDGLAITDRHNLRGVLFIETDAAGGVRVVDLQGIPVPHTRAEGLPDGRLFVADDAAGDVTWYGRDGLRQGTGIRVADPAHQGEVFLFRADGAEPVFVDRIGTKLPGTVEILPGGGFRITDNATYQVYDDAGVHQAHGYGVNLQGETGFLEIGATGGRRLDLNHQPLPGRVVTLDAAAGEITVTRAGGHDVFDLRGAVVREVTDLDQHGISQVGGRVTRTQDGSVNWTAANGTPMPTPHRVTIDQNGGVRLEVNLPGSPRNGEYHQFSRDGHLVEQGFPVIRNGQATQYTYVVNRVDNTWSRSGGTERIDGIGGTGGFLHGKVEVAGVDNGRIKLVSSTAKEVEVFERRWLPNDSILDSFRKTDTLGFSWFDRRTSWAAYDNTGGLANWGHRVFDNSGAAWRDLDHNGRAVRDYQQGLQKYDNPVAGQITPMGKAEDKITGHVLATRQIDGSWQWHRYDAQGSLIAQGDRVPERIGEGWTDNVTVRVNGQDTTEIAQRKWGTWHGSENARQYKEFTLTRGTDGVERPGTWELQSPQGKAMGSGEQLDNGSLLQVKRQGEQRPPVWVRENFLGNPAPTGTLSHIAADNRFQIFRWETTGGTNPGQGIRYVGADEATVDVDLNGAFVRSSGKLHDGTVLKVGDNATGPQVAHPQAGALPWEAGEQHGWRLIDNNQWKDVAQVDGQPGWTVVRESQPGGAVREFPQPRDRNIWIQRDPHGNLVGQSHLSPGPARGPQRYVVATGAADSGNWRWHELDANGAPIAGREGDRFHFKGSLDERITWDNSFRDFDAVGNLVRDRHLLDEGRYVESWRSDNGNWRSVEFDKTGQQVADAPALARVWGNGDGHWSNRWTTGSTHFADVKPRTDQLPRQVIRETPQHIGDGRPVRVREYTVTDGRSDLGQWKEFDFDKVVRERTLSGDNYLETDKLHGQWKLYDGQGHVIGERSDNGLVFELRDGRLTLTGNEYDFRGALSEFRGWNTRVSDAQRQPWKMGSDWTFSTKTLTPGANPARVEAAYASYSGLLTQKILLQIGTEFILDYAASLMILGIIAEAQNKPFTGTDALKALMNAAVGTTLRTAAGAALTETRLGGTLRDLKQSMGNLDGGKLITKRPNNNDASWGVEWAGNTGVTKWREGVFDYSLGMMLLPLTGFVNGTMNAAIFGVTTADGKTVKLSGWEAVGEGGIAILTGYSVANSLGLARTIGMQVTAGRYFQKGGLADIGLQMPLRLFEKGIAGGFLAPAIRESINPSWYQSPASPPDRGGGVGSASTLTLPASVTVPAPGSTPSGLLLPPGTGGAQ